MHWVCVCVWVSCGAEWALNCAGARGSVAGGGGGMRVKHLRCCAQSRHSAKCSRGTWVWEGVCVWGGGGGMLLDCWSHD